mmetsp:Transcript_65001/g.188460  ORF Transcript_65001/g.188460 Transcript_65001/m.188460 type:complete len:454 (+) Transcript_65001:95-1456(+)
MDEYGSIQQIFSSAVEIMLVFMIAFLMKRLGYCDQTTAKKVIEVVIVFFVPMSLLVYVPRVQFQTEWLVLAAAPLVFNVLTSPLLRLIFLKVAPNMPRDERGQMLLCCTGHAQTLVGYPIMRAIYGEGSLPLCAMFDLSNFAVAYITTYIIAAVYASSMDDADKSAIETSSIHAIGDVVLRGVSASSMKRPPLDPVLDGHGHRDPAAEADERLPDLIRQPIDPTLLPDPALVAGATVGAVGASATECQVDLELAASACEARITREDTSSPGPLVGDAGGRPPNCGRIAMGTSVLMWRICVRVAKMPAALAFVCGLVLRSFGVTTDHLPRQLAVVIQSCAACTQILTIFGLGLFFQPHLLLQRKLFRRLATVLLGKYGFGLAAGLASFVALRSFDVMVPTALAIALVMPTPPVVIAYADEYGYDVGFAALVVNATLLASFVLAFALALLLPFLR